MKLKMVPVYVLQLAAAGILFYTSYSKLSSQPTEIRLFSELGMEPTGRFIIGIVEGLAAVFLLTGRMAATGALLALGTMIGAMIAHLTVIGFDLPHMILWSTVFISSLTVLIVRRRQFPFIGRTLAE